MRNIKKNKASEQLLLGVELYNIFESTGSPPNYGFPDKIPPTKSPRKKNSRNRFALNGIQRNFFGGIFSGGIFVGGILSGYHIYVFSLYCICIQSFQSVLCIQTFFSQTCLKIGKGCFSSLRLMSLG